MGGDERMEQSDRKREQEEIFIFFSSRFPNYLYSISHPIAIIFKMKKEKFTIFIIKIFEKVTILNTYRNCKSILMR